MIENLCGFKQGEMVVFMAKNEPNEETILLRWKQATTSFQAAARYPAHAIQDVAWLLNELKEKQEQIEKYEKLITWLQKG